jgi:signal transduction histidine kinase
MAYEFTPFVIPFGLAVGCLCIPLYFVHRMSDTRLRAGLLLWATPVLIWACASLLRLGATTVPQERLWYTVRFVGPALAAPGYFLFTAAYTTRRQWFRPRRLAGLVFIPTVTLVLVWTNSVHQLVWTAVSPSPGTTGPFVMAVTPGPWFVVHAVYSYFLVAVGTAWLAHRLWEFRSRTFYRGQIAAVFLAVVVVVGTSLSFNLGITTVDWTPVAGAFTALVFAGAASRYRLFDVSPLAREVVVRNMDSGMLVTDARDEIIDANSRAAMILDTGVNDLIGTPLEDVFIASSETVEEVHGGSEATETIQVDHDDAVRYYDISVSPVSDPSDVYLGRVIVFSDVTERVRRRNHLQEHKEQLERQTEQLEQFASVVSHDLRNPLNVITARTDLARRTGEQEHFDAIDRAAHRMDTIIAETLTLARAGETVDEFESLILARVVRRSWEQIRTAESDLEVDLPEDTVVRADRNRLLQVFENLFRNALDHSDSPVTVRVGTTRGARSGNASAGGFFVEDTGSGIPPSDRDKVFEQGYTTGDSGAGFGLAIVENIVVAHGWEISVTEGAEGGARFEIAGVDIVE